MSTHSLTSTLAETLSVFENKGAPLTTSEVTDTVDVGRRSTYERLERLVDHGYLRTKKVGASARVWWQPVETVSDNTELDQESNSVFDNLFGTAPFGILLLDDEDRIVWINETAAAYFDHKHEQLVGQDHRTLIADQLEPIGELKPGGDDAVTGPHDTHSSSQRFVCCVESDGDEEPRWLTHWSQPIATGAFSGGRVAFYYDVTCMQGSDQFGRESQDDSLASGLASGTDTVGPWEDSETYFHQLWESFTATGELDGTRGGGTTELSQVGAMEGVITDRMEHKEKLEMQVRKQEVITEFGRQALEDKDIDSLMADAAQLVAETLDTDYCKVLDLSPDANELLLRQGVGWHEGITGQATVSSVEDNSQAAYTLQSEQPIVVENLNTESRFSGPDLLTDHDVKSGISVIIGSLRKPWGILGTHDRECKQFSDQDVNFVQSVANILSAAINRHEDEQELVHQRERTQKREQALRQVYQIIGRSEQSFSSQVEALLSLVRDTVGTEYATLSQVQGDKYVFESIVGPDDAGIEAGDSVQLEATNCKRALSLEQTLALDNIESDAPDLASRTGNAEWGITSYLGTPVLVDGDPYGTFCFYDMGNQNQEFTSWEIAFVELLGNWVSNELERQHHIDQLAALNELNTVVNEITETIITKSNRTEIEQSVCDTLAATDSYQFAWIAEVDKYSSEFTPRVSANTDGYDREITISVDPENPKSCGPAASAIETQETQVIQNVFSDPDFEPWRGLAAEYGFESMVAIPIAHDGTVYGIIGVYTDRSNAFGTAEQSVVGRLGEVVGHAIAAGERKRALMSDEVVELSFQIQNMNEYLGLTAESEGTISLDEVIPLKNDEYLIYGSASENARESIKYISENVPFCSGLHMHRDEGDTTFEISMSEPPVISTLATLGGSLERAVIEDGDYHLTVHLSPSTNIRTIIEKVEETYPRAELIARQQVTRTENKREQTTDHLIMESLTERQLATLRAAFYSGFFEWPRDSSGEDVAESLGVASSTFHQHLRKAEAKIVKSLIAGDQPS